MTIIEPFYPIMGNGEKQMNRTEPKAKQYALSESPVKSFFREESFSSFIEESAHARTQIIRINITRNNENF